MPTAKNGLRILNLHHKNHRNQKKKTFLFNVLLLKYYPIFSRNFDFMLLFSIFLFKIKNWPKIGIKNEENSVVA